MQISKLRESGEGLIWYLPPRYVANENLIQWQITLADAQSQERSFARN